MMNLKGVALVCFALSICSCNIPEDTKESIPLSKIEALDELSKIDEPVEEAKLPKLLLKASFIEPFMAAEFYEDKAVFAFSDNDTLILKQTFDSLSFSKDFKFNGSVDNKSINITIENKPCIHPGSGETWDKKATVEIDKVLYQGCAKIK